MAGEGRDGRNRVCLITTAGFTQLQGEPVTGVSLCRQRFF